MTPPGRATYARLLAGPVAHALAVGAASIGAFVYVMSRPPGTLHTGRAVGDVDAIGALLFISAILHPVATVVACRVEQLEQPGLRDHLRHASVSYLLAASFLLFAWPGRGMHGGSLGFAVGALLGAAGLMGIVTNASSLVGWRLRRARAAVER